MDSKIQISASMLRNYLSIVTVGWFDQRNLPSSMVGRYAPLVAELRDEVAAAGDLQWFKLGLHYILRTPTVAASGFANTRFSYTERESREIIEYVLKELKNEAMPEREDLISRVELEEMSRENWLVLREKQLCYL